MTASSSAPSFRRAWAEGLFYPVLRRALRRQFHGIAVARLPQTRALLEDASIVVAANHTNWWDGFVLSWVTRVGLPGAGFLLAMEEANLARYGFFRKLGVFGIDLATSRGAALGLRRVVPGLQRGREVCWIFPQGRLLHPTRPVECRPGAGWLARKAGVPLLPAAVSYEWLIESRPSVFVRFGEPIADPADALALSEAINRLRWQIVQEAADLRNDLYDPVLSPRLSLNKRWDQIRRIWHRDATPLERFNR